MGAMGVTAVFKLRLICLIFAGAFFSQDAAADDWTDCNSGRRDDAVEIIKNCTIVILGQNPAEMPIALRNRAQAFVNQGEFDLAIGDYSRAIDFDQRDGRGFEMRGYAFLRKGDRDRAIADFSTAIQLSERKDMAYRAYLGRARAEEQKGLMPEAIADYLRAADAYPPLADEIHHHVELLSHARGP